MQPDAINNFGRRCASGCTPSNDVLNITDSLVVCFTIVKYNAAQKKRVFLQTLFQCNLQLTKLQSQSGEHWSFDPKLTAFVCKAIFVGLHPERIVPIATTQKSKSDIHPICAKKFIRELIE